MTKKFDPSKFKNKLKNISKYDISYNYDNDSLNKVKQFNLKKQNQIGGVTSIKINTGIDVNVSFEANKGYKIGNIENVNDKFNTVPLLNFFICKNKTEINANTQCNNINDLIQKGKIIQTNDYGTKLNYIKLESNHKLRISKGTSGKNYISVNNFLIMNSNTNLVILFNLRDYIEI